MNAFATNTNTLIQPSWSDIINKLDYTVLTQLALFKIVSYQAVRRYLFIQTGKKQQEHCYYDGTGGADGNICDSSTTFGKT